MMVISTLAINSGNWLNRPASRAPKSITWVYIRNWVRVSRISWAASQMAPMMKVSTDIEISGCRQTKALCALRRWASRSSGMARK